MTADTREIRRSVELLVEPDTVVELRVIGALRKGTVSGYYSDVAALARDAAAWSGRAEAVYVTINPVKPDLLARAANRTIDWARHTTSDGDIIARRWLLIDLDPVRAAGISSTDAERGAAHERGRALYRWLRDHRVPEAAMAVASSGNGLHLLVRVELPNDAASLALLTRCLAVLDLHFSDGAVIVDQRTANAARISKVYGTLAAKGDSTPERPHRVARLLVVPKHVIACHRDILDRIAALTPAAAPTVRGPGRGPAPFDVEAFVARHAERLHATGPRAWQGGRKWTLRICPWNGEHINDSAFIVQFPNGAVAAGCHHNGCRGNDWHALRELLEPRSSDHRFSVEIL